MYYIQVNFLVRFLFSHWLLYWSKNLIFIRNFNGQNGLKNFLDSKIFECPQRTFFFRVLSGFFYLRISVKNQVSFTSNLHNICIHVFILYQIYKYTYFLDTLWTIGLNVISSLFWKSLWFRSWYKKKILYLQC